MKKTLVLLFLLVPFLAACSLPAELNLENLNQGTKIVNDLQGLETLEQGAKMMNDIKTALKETGANPGQATSSAEIKTCLKDGASVESTETVAGIDSGRPSCCAGFKEINPSPSSGDPNVCVMVAGTNNICAPCGNNNCEEKYGEHRCNCPEDCQ